MSNPDFPGPSWQDRPESADKISGYRGRDNGFGQVGDAATPRRDGDQAGYRSAQASYDGPPGAAGDPAYGGRGPGSGAGYEGPLDPRGGSDHGGYRGRDDRDYDDGGYHGSRGPVGNGSPTGTGNVAGNGYPAGNGYAAANGSSAGNGYASGNGSTAGNSYASGGYGGNDRGSAGYGYEQDAYASRAVYGGDGGRVPGGPGLHPGSPGYLGGPADDDDFGDDLYRPGDDVDPVPGRRFGLPGGRGPGGRGPGGRGPGGARRGGPRGLLDPDGRPTRPPGNWLQRQWRASWWRHWTLKKASLLATGLAATLALVLVAGFLVIYNHYKLPLSTLGKPLDQSSVVYFGDGKTPVGCFCTTNRHVLTTAELAQDKYLEPAFFAAEDRNYLNEGGISLTGTARAILVDLSGTGYQGGSTITEQFIKTYLDPTGLGNLTTKEKLQEIVLAVKLAKAKPKPWILTHYLNDIYLGSGAWGVEAAAQVYFGKNAWQLDVAQAAMLASMVQYPSFDPTHPAQVIPLLKESLLSRWVAVLGNMARPAANTPGITSQQLDAILPVPNPTTPSQLQQDLKHFPKIVKASKATGSWSGWHGYIMADVERELQTTYGLTPAQISSGGYQITTTVSKRKMNALYSAVHEAKGMMRAGGVPMPGYMHIGVALENPKNGAIEAVYEGPNPNLPHKACVRLLCSYPMATYSRNQVGSSFKPYVLAAAVQQKMNVQTSILNGYSPLCVPPETQAMTMSKPGSASTCPSDGPGWLAVSYDPVVEGPVSVAKAAAKSSNAAFEDLAHRVGTGSIIRLADSFGVNIAPASQHGSGLTNDVGQIGIALGIAPLTVEEQANTFAVLANGGTYHTPHFIAKLSRNGQSIPIKVQTHPVLSPAEAADVDWALSFDTIDGTGVPNAVLSPYRPTIAKTGTTDVAESAFFVGALPQQYSLAVGMFTNEQDNIAGPGHETLDALPYVGGTGGGYGGAWPATIWRLYMTRLLAMRQLPVQQLAPLNLIGFNKWVQAKRPKKKCKQQNGPPKHGHGLPLDHGHGHGGPGGPGGPGAGPCPSGSPSPSPGPSGSPSVSPSPSPSGSPSVSPSPSGSPSPSPSLGFPANPGRRPARKQASAAPSLTTSALLQRPVSAKLRWAATTTGLV